MQEAMVLKAKVGGRVAVDRADGLVAEVARSLILAGAERVKGQLCQCRQPKSHHMLLLL